MTLLPKALKSIFRDKMRDGRKICQLAHLLNRRHFGLAFTLIFKLPVSRGSVKRPAFRFFSSFRDFIKPAFKVGHLCAKLADNPPRVVKFHTGELTPCC